MLIEVLYALPQRAISVVLDMPHGSTLSAAVQMAAQRPEFAAIDIQSMPAGVFGRIAPRDHPLTEGDRIEIYRPLAEDPKLARRARAKEFARRQRAQ